MCNKRRTNTARNTNTRGKNDPIVIWRNFKGHFLSGQTYKDVLGTVSYETEAEEWSRRTHAFPDAVASSGRPQQDLHTRRVRKDHVRRRITREIGTRVKDHSKRTRLQTGGGQQVVSCPAKPEEVHGHTQAWLQ